MVTGGRKGYPEGERGGQRRRESKDKELGGGTRVNGPEPRENLVARGKEISMKGRIPPRRGRIREGEKKPVERGLPF